MNEKMNIDDISLDRLKNMTITDKDVDRFFVQLQNKFTQQIIHKNQLVTELDQQNQQIEDTVNKLKYLYNIVINNELIDQDHELKIEI